MNNCPCGSEVEYLKCCGLYLEKKKLPSTPEALMRSRYTAYTQANTDYIKRTMFGKPLQNFNDIEAAYWAKSVCWQGLKVISSYLDNNNNNIGYVEFKASFLSGNQPQTIHELSKFELLHGQWFYTDNLAPKTKKTSNRISRNAPCPCGSRKKFKNCHGLS